MKGCGDAIELLRQLFLDLNNFRKAVLCLEGCAFIRRKDDDNIWMHDLVCEFSKNLVTPSEMKLVAASALLLARGAFPDPQDYKNWKACEEDALHVVRSSGHTRL